MEQTIVKVGRIKIKVTTRPFSIRGVGHGEWVTMETIKPKRRFDKRKPN